MQKKGKTMGFRKVSGKKYNSIYEYYKDSDHDKKTIAYYIMYRDLENKTKKIKCDATNPNNSILNQTTSRLAL